ncbi:MAG: YihY/virulence factor BrkB family protein [Paludibacter sp.]|nr:YihY/virulence factor BrkB family protein [Paludibacter sp.]
MSKISLFIKNLLNFFRFDIWRITEFELSRTRKLLYRLVKIVILSTRVLIKERLSAKASALTYSILFAIVPMFALIIAIGRGFGVEDMIEKSLQSTFIAQANMIPTVMKFVKNYLETTQGGLFIGIGLIILLFSVINFFRQVELSFNAIWKVKKSRSVINQITMYFSAMLVIPVLLVFMSGFSIFISTKLTQTYMYYIWSPLIRFVVYFSPYFINWVVFTIMYMAIPNTKVKFSNALIAGVIAGSAFQVFQVLYINGQVYLARYNVVYGSFAAFPLLLLWLQISCLIVLLGAQISYASQNIQNFEYELDAKNISHRYKNFLNLFVTYIIFKQLQNNGTPLTGYQIANIYKLPIRLVNEALDDLTDVNVIIEVYDEKHRTKSYQPAVDINQLTVKALLEKLESYGSEEFLANKDELLDIFWHKTIELDEHPELLSDELLVKDIV